MNKVGADSMSDAPESGSASAMLALAAQAQGVQSSTPTPFGRAPTSAEVSEEDGKKTKLKSYQATEKEFIETNHKLFSVLTLLRWLFPACFY